MKTLVCRKCGNESRVNLPSLYSLPIYRTCLNCRCYGVHDIKAGGLCTQKKIK